MIPKNNRLKSSSDFAKVFSSGKISQNKLIRIKYTRNQKKFSRFGFVVGAKFAKKATERNLVKRRLRTAGRELVKNIKPGFDIVVWPLGAARKSPYRELLANFKDLLIKNDLLPL